MSTYRAVVSIGFTFCTNDLICPCADISEVTYRPTSICFSKVCQQSELRDFWNSEHPHSWFHSHAVHTSNVRASHGCSTDCFFCSILPPGSDISAGSPDVQCASIVGKWWTIVIDIGSSNGDCLVEIIKLESFFEKDLIVIIIMDICTLNTISTLAWFEVWSLNFIYSTLHRKTV